MHISTLVMNYKLRNTSMSADGRQGNKSKMANLRKNPNWVQFQLQRVLMQESCQLLHKHSHRQQISSAYLKHSKQKEMASNCYCLVYW